MEKGLILIFFLITLTPILPVFGSEPESLEQYALEHNTTLSDHNDTFLTDMDSFQNYWSHKVLLFSSNLDHKLSGTSEENLSVAEDNKSISLPSDNIQPPTSNNDIKKIRNEETYNASLRLDEFFKDETHLDTTNRSYIKLRSGFEYDRRGSSSLFYNVLARIKLPKTQEKLQLYIGEDTQENTKLSTTQNGANNEGVGLKYFIPSLYDRLFSSASIGISRIDNPYAKARIEYPLFIGNRLFKPTQNFKLSLDNRFEEWTNLYIDRKISDQEVLRLLLQRSTQSGVIGMNYLSQLSYMNTLNYGIGFNHYLALSGRTKDLTGTLYANGTTPQAGVYEYSVGTIWRQKIFRDYLFYQLQPMISFHEQYGYMPNYIFRISMEFYFGNNR